MNIKLIIIVITVIYCISFILDAIKQVYFKKTGPYRKYKKQQHKVENLERECRLVQDEIRRGIR